MSPLGAADPQILVRLVEDIFRLREIIQTSEGDSALKLGSETQAPVRFNYLIDTPVLQYYAEPHRLARHVSALPLLHPADEADDDGDGERAGHALALDDYEQVHDAIRNANALLTAEYLFSEALAPEGVYVSPEHRQEMARYVEAVEDAFLRQGQPAPGRGLGRAEAPRQYADLRRELNEIQRVYEHRPEDEPAKLLHSTRSVVIKRLSEIAATRLMAAGRLDRLFASGRVAGATSHPAYTTEVIAPDPELVSDWTKRIRREKQRNTKQPSDVAYDADGATLAQLSLLNSNWRETGEVFVLLSDDRGLHRAYARWIKENADGNEEPFFPLRFCRQYSPILNMRDMGGSYQDAEIFQRIRTAVFRFTDSFASSDFRSGPVGVGAAPAAFATPTHGEIRRHLERRFGRADWNIDASSRKPLSVSAAVLQHSIKGITSLWVEAMALAVTAKADTLAEIADFEGGYWARLLYRLEFDHALKENVDQLSNAFDTSTVASTLLRHDFWALDAASHRGELKDHGRRIVASAFTDFHSDAFEGRTVAQLTDELPERKDAVTVLLQARIEERLLVLGALCLEIGSWLGAANMLGEADNRLSRQRAGEESIALRREVVFHRCVVRRVNTDHLRWKAEYEALEKILAGLLADATDELDLARIKTELLALEVSRFAWPLSYDEAKTAAKRGLDVVLDALATPGEAAMTRTDDDGPWSLVRSQFLLNVLVLTYWWGDTFESVTEELAAIARRAMEMTANVAGPKTPHMLHIPVYPDLARYALSTDHDERRRLASGLIRQLNDVIDRDEGSGYAFDVANVDKAEYRKIQRLLLAKGGRPPGSA